MTCLLNLCSLPVLSLARPASCPCRPFQARSSTRFQQALPSLQQLSGQSSSTGRSRSCRVNSRRQAFSVCAVAEKNPDAKLISKTEVPAFISRRDFADQMLRWAVIEQAEYGPAKYGMPFKITKDNQEQGVFGFVTSFQRSASDATDIAFRFDTDIAIKHEWVGRGEDGFPLMQGGQEEVTGKHLEIWKTDSNPVDEPTRAAVRLWCQELGAAINKYYAFGSCFVDDSQ
ncbi:hypothetical protein WJX74_001522 [Apatococcus lobatus]|uniref:Uncharacterized protein n=1 Tax=Apatococcus lobatus TaxID=904363 RepID=A0AAW1QDF2_9CHLO